MRTFLRDLESAWWRFLKPEFNEPTDEELQSFDEQTRVRTAFIRKSAHPAGCDGTDNCGCAS